MANLNTFAKLIKPPQFDPSQEVTFRLEYSMNMSCTYATLKIYGYTQVDFDDGRSYFGTKITKYMYTSQSGVGIEEFIVAPYTLFDFPKEGEHIYTTSPSGAKAIVEIGNELDEDGNAIPLYTSNEISLDMVWWYKDDFVVIDANKEGSEYYNNLSPATGSTKSIDILYTPRGGISSYGSCDINSYSILLYDENYNLINQSLTYYDWNDSTRARPYTITDLEDNTSYYIRIKATLVGGYIRYTEYIPLNVKYEILPSLSSELQLSNNYMDGCVDITLTTNIAHTKAVITRSEINSFNFLELKQLHGNISGIVIKDSYALPDVSYIYKIVLYDSTGNITSTFYNTITHKLQGMGMSDCFGNYSTVIYDNYTISKNDRSSIAEPIDNPLPYSICNGDINYDSGDFNATFVKPKNECEYDFNPADGHHNSDYSHKIRHWLNNGMAKLLKTSDGQAWIVSVSAVKSTIENGLIKTSFSWTEIADAKDITQYKEQGLIIDE